MLTLHNVTELFFSKGGIIIKAKFTTEQLRAIYETCSKKELYKDWNEVAAILNKRFNLSYNESTYRKAWQYFDRMFNACKDIFMTSDDGCKELDTKKRELERAKIQFRDERNAWQRQNYNAARVEQKLDALEKYIMDNHHIQLDVKAGENNPDRIAVVCCSDWHIGTCYDNEFGTYNSDIAKKRIAEYASKAIYICRRNDVGKVIIAGLGDSINGSIHRSVQVTNRENVIEQIMLASELMLSFIEEFLRKGMNVIFTNVSGNHSRIDRKDDALKDERLDDIIGWYCNTHLRDCENFTYSKAEDTSFSSVLGFWFCHGDYDSFSKNGLANLVLAKGYKPNAVFMGHYHTMAINDCYDVKICRSGCLGGSGDDYTVQKRLKGKPSQLVAIAEGNDVNQFYNITFEK